MIMPSEASVLTDAETAARSPHRARRAGQPRSIALAICGSRPVAARALDPTVCIATSRPIATECHGADLKGQESSRASIGRLALAGAYDLDRERYSQGRVPGKKLGLMGESRVPIQASMMTDCCDPRLSRDAPAQPIGATFRAARIGPRNKESVHGLQDRNHRRQPSRRQHQPQGGALDLRACATTISTAR